LDYSRNNHGSPDLITNYDPGWPEQFEILRCRVAKVLGDLVARIEHVGSTAVPGLAARPIIDLDVLLASSKSLPAAIDGLAALGYKHQGDLGIPGREAFKPPPGPPSHHLYLFSDSSGEFSRHLAFRDYLRTNPDGARAYEGLKRTLALRFAEDRTAYVDGKNQFIREALQRFGLAGKSMK
jgi:GrpB-like predicted nucleotidyltransferase (UPF0157 family)